MFLKAITTMCLVVGVLLFLPYALLLQSPPTPATPKAERKAYAEKLFLYNGFQLLSLVGAGVGAMLIVRKARADYRDESIHNMRVLLEVSKEKPPE